MTVLQPADVVDDGGLACFDAAVIRIDRLVLADRGILETIGLLLGDEALTHINRSFPAASF